ncbi:MAG: hypothetical protein LBU70_07690 [Chitinispirillales bacterium]|jgi:exopolyphosphatase/guanosine-5'-triphosphate,3'-diphosphate pyrophosphatase|nr:hypothetical protein [Chitinispirillales bacterium]
MIAIVDIGSNTIRLSAYEIDVNGGFSQICRIKCVIGLAAYIDKKGTLSDVGIAETAAALNGFRAEIEAMNVSEVRVFATSAFRDVANTADIISTIKRKTGFDVTVISGEEEALCGFAGATNDAPLTNGIFIDIGGGSTELILSKNGNIEMAVSIAIGSLDMYTKHVTRVLPTAAQSKKIRLDTLKKLEKIGPKKSTVKELRGVGGTMRALYQLNNAIFDLPPENRAVRASNVEKLLEMIDTDTHRIVGKILNITPERIHTVTPGMIILYTIIKYYDCETVVVSESGVREGYLIRNVLKNRDTSHTPLLPPPHLA